MTLPKSFFFQNKNINEVEKGRNSCLDIESLVQKKPITPVEVSTGMFKLGSRKCVRKKTNTVDFKAMKVFIKR